jgi:hypothetical protein
VPFSIALAGHTEKKAEEQELLDEIKTLVAKYKFISYAAFAGSLTTNNINQTLTE